MWLRWGEKNDQEKEDTTKVWPRICTILKIIAAAMLYVITKLSKRVNRLCANF